MAEAEHDRKDAAAGQQKPARRPPRLWWWLAWSAAGLLLLFAAGAAGYYLLGQAYWTDERGIRLPADQVKPRQVLWTDPEAFKGQLNTAEHEYEPAICPDGSELYFVRGLPGKNADIYLSRRGEAGWSQPAALAAVNSEHDELGPRPTPDGRFLLFYSDRPGGLGQYDLWAAPLTPAGWGQPFNLGPAVNTRWNEYSPACDPAGRLYFASNRKAAAQNPHEGWAATIRQSGSGDYDLFVAEPAAAATAPAGPLLGFAPARELEGVNTPQHEGACCIAPGGDFLYFTSDRPGGAGGFDLYRCRLLEGKCSRVENLGPTVNTATNESDPLLAEGGFQLYFSSDRGGEKTGYDVFFCESREVYARHFRRPLPQLGWQTWVLVAGLAVLAPLLLFMKAGGYRHLNLFQKCVLLSLLAHVLLMVSCGWWWLYKPIILHIARQAGMDIPVSLQLSRQLEVVRQIRQQITDVPVADPSLAEVRPARQVAVPRADALATEVNVPKVRLRPAAMSLQPEAPPKVPPKPSELVSLPPPSILAEEPSIQLDLPEPVAEAEPQPGRQEPQPLPARMAATPPPTAQPSPVRLKPQHARRPSRSPKPLKPPRQSSPSWSRSHRSCGWSGRPRLTWPGPKSRLNP